MAYCGFDCRLCPVAIATHNKDKKQLAQLAKKYSLPTEKIECCGCTGDLFSDMLCGFCKIRPCARKKGIDICAHCSCYPCKLIDDALQPGTAGRKRLDNIYNMFIK